MKNFELKHLSVLGGGLMGHGIAQVFAQAGCRVVVNDISPEVLAQVVPKIRTNLEQMSAYGLIRAESTESILKRVSTSASLAAAVQEAELVIEAVPENMELKQKIFAELDRLCPEQTILATNTSAISITAIASASQGRERIVGTHFWNPGHLLPLVEVVPGADTSAETVARTMEILTKVGKHPVRVNQDVPGFVCNRLQHALWREAISIVERGIATPEAVDEVIKFGFGLRLPVLGPLENADMVGLDLTLSIHAYLLKYLEASPEPSPILREKNERGELGFKTGQGFQKWPEPRQREVHQRLVEYLMKWHAAQKDD